MTCVQEGAEGAVEQSQPADRALRPAGPADTATAVPAARHTDQSVAEVLFCSYSLYTGFSVTECRPVMGCSESLITGCFERQNIDQSVAVVVCCVLAFQ